MQVLCLTSDKLSWLMVGFSYLWDKYCGLPVLYGGCTEPVDGLFGEFAHTKTGAGCPSNKWSNSTIDILSKIEDDVVLIVLEDYWLMRRVDIRALRLLSKYMSKNTDIIRIDLTNDRAHAKGDPRDAERYGYCEWLDMIITHEGTPYQMSLQAGLWNIQKLLNVLRKDKSPWETEIHTSIGTRDGLVLGTLQHPMRYCNVMRQGEVQQDQLELLSNDDRKQVTKYIKKEF